MTINPWKILYITLLAMYGDSSYLCMVMIEQKYMINCVMKASLNPSDHSARQIQSEIIQVIGIEIKNIDVSLMR